MENDWWVIGRNNNGDPKLILVECQRTGKLGSVSHFTEDQWTRAAQGVYNPWRWASKWGEVLEMTATVA